MKMAGWLLTPRRGIKLSSMDYLTIITIIVISFQVTFPVIGFFSINYIGWSLCKRLDACIERIDARAAQR